MSTSVAGKASVTTQEKGTNEPKASLEYKPGKMTEHITNTNLCDETGLKQDSSQLSADIPAVPSTSPASLSGVRYLLVIGSFLLSLYLTNLDRVIVATALPVTASEFDALDQAAWIATAFLVTQGACMMGFAQIMTVASNKWTYIAALLIFELGNLLCAVAWNFPALVVGRAIGGIGSAGTFVAVIVLVSTVTRLDQRPMLFALFGIIVAIANISGPLMGGGFTDHVTWRWCFYISLPPGAINIAVIAFVLHDSEVGLTAGSDKLEKTPVWKRFMRLDWIGNALLLAIVFALVVPLQGAGVTMSWSDRRTIILLCLFGLFTVLFVSWEKYLGSAKAVLPLTFFKRPTMTAAVADAFLTVIMISVGFFFFPLYYQAARDRTAIQAGIDILPFLIGTIIGTLGAAFIIKGTGKPWPFLFASPLVASLTAGLIFWVLRTAPKGTRGALIGLQIVYGLSTGSVVQQPMIAAQAEYRQEPRMMPQASAMVHCMQMIGGAVGVAIAGAILNVRIPLGLAAYVPGLPPDTAQAVLESVSAIRGLESLWKEGVKRAYAEALGYVFLLCVPAGILASCFSLIMKRPNLKS